MMKETLLGFNIDHAATLRQARYRGYDFENNPIVEPSPLDVALAGERAGADGITLHLREDRRHIQEYDVWLIKDKIQTRLNLEMACTEAMTQFALELMPAYVCLVPESREEITTEGGLDLVSQKDRVGAVVRQLEDAGIKVSLFIDPEREQIEMAAAFHASYIELHTGAYANAFKGPSRQAELDKIVEAYNQARDLGLTVNAGHGLNYRNVQDVAASAPFHEFNIGHSIIAYALMHGMHEAVAKMKQCIRGERHDS